MGKEFVDPRHGAILCGTELQQGHHEILRVPMPLHWFAHICVAPISVAFLGVASIGVKSMYSGHDVAVLRFCIRLDPKQKRTLPSTYHPERIPSPL